MTDFQEVRERLTTLETQSEERWKAHDTQSKIIWGEIKEDVKAIFGLLAQSDKQGREDDKDRMKKKDICMKEAKEYAKSLVSWVLGVPAGILTVVGVIWGVIKISQALSLG